MSEEPLHHLLLCKVFTQLLEIKHGSRTSLDVRLQD